MTPSSFSPGHEHTVLLLIIANHHRLMCHRSRQSNVLRRAPKRQGLLRPSVGVMSGQGHSKLGVWSNKQCGHIYVASEDAWKVGLFLKSRAVYPFETP